LERGDTQLSKLLVRGESFVGAVSEGELINAGYIQSLAHGRSSNDEAQAWVREMEEGRSIEGTALSSRRGEKEWRCVVCWDERGRPDWGDLDEINRRAKK
jgi:hypothetical protein